MKICIAGGRDFADYNVLANVVDLILAEMDASPTIVSGCAKGADSLGERYALERGLNVLPFPADWKKHGRAAGPIRNAQMADEADMLVVFWDGASRGTRNMIDQMKRRGKPYRAFDYSGRPISP